MLFFGFTNESFLYAADLRFRLTDDANCMEGLLKSAGMKNEDAQQNLNDKIGQLKSRFRAKFDTLVE